MDNASYAYESRKPRIDDANPVVKELADKNWEVALLRAQLQDAEDCIRGLTDSDVLFDDSVASESGLEDASLRNLLCLKRINFECTEGEFIAVIGGKSITVISVACQRFSHNAFLNRSIVGVGCGKSSFLNAILGEVRQLSGSTAVKGNLSFFAQSAFIMNATVRDNILFGHVGEEIDEERYQLALTCCSLRHDLDQLPAGDMTEIGEKGITLSGGQKARVAMARAVYHSADICLLDDPLAAVDAHVGSYLFQKCIVDELLLNKSRSGGKRRTVILSTNALQYLSSPMVDRIVVMKEGRVAEQGTFHELRKGDTIFSKYLAVIAESGVSRATIESAEETESVDRHSIREAAHRLSTATEAFISDASLQASVPQLAPPTELFDVNIEADDNLDKAKDTALMTDELREREIGHVDRKLYFIWAQAAGGYWIPFVIVFAYAAAEGVTVLSKWWLTYWSHHAGPEGQYIFLSIYSLINLAAVVAQFIRVILTVVYGIRASRRVSYGRTS